MTHPAQWAGRRHGMNAAPAHPVQTIGYRRTAPASGVWTADLLTCGPSGRRTSGNPCPELAPRHPAPVSPRRAASLSPVPRAPDEARQREQRDAGLARMLQAVAAGDALAFEAFYDGTIAYAQALARRMVRPADLDDLLADAFFQVWREAARFDPQRGSAVTWLLTLVRSRALDLLRRQRAAPDGEVLPESAAETIADGLPGPDDLLNGAQAGSLLQRALAALSGNERWVLGLAYYREMSHSQISATTGLPLGTVKSLILRAQTRLREQLNPR
jgi:RNA polymerase sigma-70 factor, ECF subfamily